ncbi:MAG TPA: CPBP family intramembrane glutamic endopeptidase [bacterium]
MNKPTQALIAFLIAILVIATEYFFRHYVMFWFPQIGTWRVNDMVSLFIGYFLLLAFLGFLTNVHWIKEWAGIRRALYDCILTWKYIRWILAMVLCIQVFSLLDRLLFSRFTLPFFVSPYRNPAIWMSGFAPFLKAFSLIAVNGLFVPVAEEFLWRGLVQPRFESAFGASIAVGATAVLFSLKHVAVDASFNRFTMAVAFGVICGMLSLRKGWNASAALHVFINTASSVTVLVLGKI